jgi:hypothetical protein
MTDFDELYDSFDFEDLARGFLSDEDNGAQPSASSLSARVLVSGETGVQFDALVLFATPLFETYGLDLADAFTMKANPEAALPEVLAVMETARVLWAFFSLPPADRAQRRPVLAAHLGGRIRARMTGLTSKRFSTP